mmetsp:Transcript_3793/g.8150  ORF Transcript_3793/g.8150 Transcript_3793/m.8150 type:complete len:239 (+) Transcript_3793:93-809(+)
MRESVAATISTCSVMNQSSPNEVSSEATSITIGSSSRRHERTARPSSASESGIEMSSESSMSRCVISSSDVRMAPSPSAVAHTRNGNAAPPPPAWGDARPSSRRRELGVGSGGAIRPLVGGALLGWANKGGGEKGSDFDGTNGEGWEGGGANGGARGGQNGGAGSCGGGGDKGEGGGAGGCTCPVAHSNTTSFSSDCSCREVVNDVSVMLPDSTKNVEWPPVETSASAFCCMPSCIAE